MPSDLTISKLQGTTTPTASTREQEIAASHRKAGAYAKVYPNVYSGDPETVLEKIGAIQWAEQVASNEFLMNPKYRAEQSDTTLRNLAAGIAGLPADTIEFLYNIAEAVPKGVSDKPLPSLDDTLLEAFTSRRLAQQFGGDPEHASFLPTQIVAPGPGELKAMMIGVRGATRLGINAFDEGVTKRLREAAPYDQRIWEETGWYKADDGEFRFFISDADSVMNEEVISKHPFITQKINEAVESGVPKQDFIDLRLDQVLDHPKLYEAYPQLRGMRIKFSVAGNPDGSVEIRNLLREASGDRTAGSMRQRASGDIVRLDVHSGKFGDVSDPESIKRTLLHEIQHVVQTMEGFSAGGSAKLTVNMLKRYESAKSASHAMDLIQRNNIDNVDALYEALIEDGFTAKLASDAINQRDVQRYLSAYSADDLEGMMGIEISTSGALHSSENEMLHVLQYLSSGKFDEQTVAETLQQISSGLRFQDINDLGYQAYRHQLGEAEARLTEVLAKVGYPQRVPNPNQLNTVDRPLSVTRDLGAERGTVEQFMGLSDEEIESLLKTREQLKGIPIVEGP